MKDIKENEQWKLNGECEKCRRNNYCSKTCTRHSRRISSEIRSTICEAMDKVSGGAFSALTNTLE